MDFDNSREPGPDDAAPIGPARTRARLAAVQALYQMDMTQRDLSVVLEEFLTHRFETVEIYAGADRGFFRDIVTGVAGRQAEIDPQIASHLAQGWRLSRIDSILRAILRSGVYEIIVRRDVPARAIINEYVEIAHDFFGGEEPAVVNGVLDRVAREKRQDEFGRKAAKKPG
ncbi:MAG TPA: transcription antitermination factor NusB [Methylocystis sp.]|nr:transcription antitermination factor NusB [Methylocystis sp.]